MKTARIQFDPVTLTTNLGVALPKDSVQDAARKVCYSIDPLETDDVTCRAQRCLMLAAGFYEWHLDEAGRKNPFSSTWLTKTLHLLRCGTGATKKTAIGLTVAH